MSSTHRTSWTAIPPVVPPTTRASSSASTRLYAAFPDLVAEVGDLVGGLLRPTTVAVRWSAEGTHRGPYLGADPDGKRVRFKGIEILRIRDGLIVERWGEWDGIDLLEQLGRVRS